MSDELAVGWCDTRAARYAVEHWHYSRTLPLGKTVKVGAWERSRFIGCVIFARGNTNNLGKRYGLTSIECVELCRVALAHHDAPVTRIVAEALRLLRGHEAGLRLVISFADPSQGHVGRIYQAGNWLYLGQSEPAQQYLVDGRWVHQRTASGGVGFSGAVQRSFTPEQRKRLPQRTVPGKYRYGYPLDRAMRRQLAPLAQPYPRGRSVEGDTSGSHPEEAGSIPADRSTAPAIGR